MGTDPILPLAAARGLTGMSEPGDVLRALGDLCPGQVLVTDGIQGSWALDRESGGIIHQPAFVVDAVDTTGCGDAFHAGYIVGVLEGWSLALRMEFGSLLASRVAGRVGGRTALPSQKNDLIRSDISSNLHQHLIL
jgi:sugar/nucleoside kinase (ribokinase family)